VPFEATLLTLTAVLKVAGAELDVRLGECWERALARFSHDVATGMSPEPQPGPHGDGVPDLFPSTLG
jgi:hypothetical protein